MLNRAKTGSWGGVKSASLIAGEVGGGYHSHGGVEPLG